MARVKHTAGAAPGGARRVFRNLAERRPSGERRKSKRQHRFKPGTVALREIRKYQKSTALLVRRLPFKRLMREVLHDQDMAQNFRVQGTAFEAMQEAAESFMVSLLSDAGSLAIHAKRSTVASRDIQLAYKFRTHRIMD